MTERPVLVGLIPQAVVLDPGPGQLLSDAGNLRVEFDANRCPFSSNVFQVPAGMRLMSGPTIAGTKPGSFQVPTVAERPDGPAAAEVMCSVRNKPLQLMFASPEIISCFQQ